MFKKTEFKKTEFKKTEFKKTELRKTEFRKLKIYVSLKVRFTEVVSNKQKFLLEIITFHLISSDSVHPDLVL